MKQKSRPEKRSVVCFCKLHFQIGKDPVAATKAFVCFCKVIFWIRIRSHGMKSYLPNPGNPSLVLGNLLVLFHGFSQASEESQIQVSGSW